MATDYGIWIDWSNDGSFAGEYDNVTRFTLSEMAITYGRDQTRALSPLALGSASFELINTSRIFSPENVSSPIKDDILPARSVRIQAASETLNENYNFEEGVHDWSGFGTSTITSTRDYVRSGDLAAKLTSDAGTNPRAEADTVPVEASTAYRIYGYLYTPVALPTNATVGVNWHTAAGAYISTTSLTAALAVGQWQLYEGTVTSPATAGRAAARFGFSGTPGAGAVIYADEIRLTPLPVNLFRGNLDEYKVLPAVGERKVQVSALDPLSKVNESKVNTDLYESMRTGPALHKILDSVGWPGNARIIDEGATTLRWWCLNGEDAWTAIQNVLAAEGAPAMVTSDGAGNFIFLDRHHRTFTTLSKNPQFEVDTHGWTQSGGTLVRNTSDFVKGGACAQFTPDGTTAIVGFQSDQMPVTGGQAYTVQGWLKNAVARDMALNVNWFDSTGIYISTSVLTKAVAAGTWTYYITEYVAPANAVTATLVPTMVGTPAGSNVMYCDDLRFMGRSVSVATFRDEGAEPLFSAPMTYDHGWRDVVNDVTFSVDERGMQDEYEIVWSTANVYSLAADEEVSFIITTDDPFYGMEVTHYNVLTGSASVSISRIVGQSTTVTISAGGGGATVTNIELAARPLVVKRALQVVSEDTASKANYGVKSGPSEAGHATYEDAQAVADLAVAYRKNRLPIVQLDVIGSTPERLEQCLTRNLSDRITVVDAETGMNRDFYIEQISHQIDQAGLIHTTTFGCEAVPDSAELDDPATVFYFDHPTNGKFGTGTFAR